MSFAKQKRYATIFFVIVGKNIYRLLVVKDISLIRY